MSRHPEPTHSLSEASATLAFLSLIDGGLAAERKGASSPSPLVGPDSSYGAMRYVSGDLQLAEMLCSRICHDLAGPAGAVDMGLGLMADNAAGPEEHEAAVAAVALAARQLIERLTFFRSIFGRGGAARAMTAADAINLVTPMLAGRRIALEIMETPSSEASLPAAVGRLLMVVMMLAADTLPRGGRVDAAVDDSSAAWGLRVVATGRGAAVSDSTRAVLSSPDAAAASPRDTFALLSVRLAAIAGTDLEVTADDEGRIHFETTVPRALVQRSTVGSEASNLTDWRLSA